MIKKVLTRHYPFPEMMSSKLLLSVSAATIVMLILALFRPFGISGITSLIELYILGFSIISFLMVYLGYAVVPLMFPDYFNSRGWNIQKQLIHMAGIVTSIVFSNWIYSSVWMGGLYSFPTLLKFVGITLLLSIPAAFSEISLTLYLTKIRSAKQKAQ